MDGDRGEMTAARPGKASRLGGGAFVEEVEGGLGFLSLSHFRSALGEVFENLPRFRRTDAL